jgi:hypothetical protein
MSVNAEASVSTFTTPALEDWCSQIVTAELARLARRVPSLEPGDLRVVQASLNDVVDRLVLTRAARYPAVVARLFDVAEDGTGVEGISS